MRWDSRSGWAVGRLVAVVDPRDEPSWACKKYVKDPRNPACVICMFPVDIISQTSVHKINPAQVLTAFTNKYMSLPAVLFFIINSTKVTRFNGFFSVNFF